MANLLSQKRMINKLLEAHNKYRGMHGVPQLEHDPALSELAAEAALYLATNHLLKHSNKKNEQGEELGENILRVNLAADEDAEKIGGTEIAEIWYDEGDSYDFESVQFAPHSNNFTQMIWKNTQKVGFGFSVNDDDHLYVVAYYYPAGNYGNQFKENVLPPLETEKPKPEPQPEPKPESKPEPPKPEPKPEPPKPETAQEKFIREALAAHNEYRGRHSAPPLVHNPELSQVAQSYAQNLARRNCLKHSDCNWNGKRMGENLAMIMDSRLSCYPGKKTF
jgi:uncharacterized protein YkwD